MARNNKAREEHMTSSLGFNFFCLFPNIFGSHKSLDKRVKTKYLDGIFLPS